MFLCCDSQPGILKDDDGHLVSVHRVAHSLKLGVMKAIKNEAKLKRLNEMLKLPLRAVSIFAEGPEGASNAGRGAIEENVLKPTNLRGSRWMPYMLKAVKVTN